MTTRKRRRRRVLQKAEPKGKMASMVSHHRDTFENHDSVSENFSSGFHKKCVIMRVSNVRFPTFVFRLLHLLSALEIIIIIMKGLIVLLPLLLVCCIPVAFARRKEGHGRPPHLSGGFGDKHHGKNMSAHAGNLVDSVGSSLNTRNQGDLANQLLTYRLNFTNGDISLTPALNATLTTIADVAKASNNATFIRESQLLQKLAAGRGDSFDGDGDRDHHHHHHHHQNHRPDDDHEHKYAITRNQRRQGTTGGSSDPVSQDEYLHSK